VRTRDKILIGTVIAFVALLVVAYFGAGYAVYDQLGNIAGSCDRHRANRPDNFALLPDWPADFDVTPYFMSPYETVRFPSREAGFEVAGWWIPNQAADPAAPAVLVLDGLGGCKNSVSVLVPAGTLWRNGYNVLVIDVRDTGESTFDDLRSAIGNDEYLDVLGAWDWLVDEQGFAPSNVGVFANSLGGAMANYAFGEEPRMAALFLHATFGDLQEIIEAELTRNGFPSFLSFPTLVMGSLVTGENLFARSPVETISAAARRPVYIVHSHADTRIDSSQSELLAAAAQEAGVKVSTWFPENGEHMQIPAAYPQEFEQRVVGFFRENLQP
jgi:fermentation-respiration switch protein FrsA (DUF1100 family)